MSGSFRLLAIFRGQVYPALVFQRSSVLKLSGICISLLLKTHVSNERERFKERKENCIHRENSPREDGTAMMLGCGLSSSLLQRPNWLDIWKRVRQGGERQAERSGPFPGRRLAFSFLETLYSLLSKKGKTDSSFLPRWSIRVSSELVSAVPQVLGEE